MDRQKAAIAEAESEAARREDVTSQLAHSERARLEVSVALQISARHYFAEEGATSRGHVKGTIV